MTQSLVRVRPYANEQGGFNRPVALAIYDAIAKCADDEEAAGLSLVLLGSMMDYEFRTHGDEIGKAADTIVTKRFETVRLALTRRAISKAIDGEEIESTVAALEELRKVASFQEAWDREHAETQPMSDAERSRVLADHARSQKRDLLTGRFVQDSHTVVHLEHERPLHAADAKLLGIPDVPKLTTEQRVHFQRGYREVQDMLKNYHGLKPDTAAIHFHYETGAPDVAMLGAGGKIPVKGHEGALSGLDPRRKVTEVKLSTLPADSLQSPRVQAYLGSAMSPGGLGNADTWDPAKGGFGYGMTAVTDEEQFTPGAKHLRRVGVLSEAIANTLGDHAPARLKLALDVGQHAGKLGPEAQKVLGPAADKAAYRYRGIERKQPDTRLAHAVAASRRDPTLRPAEKREALIHGSVDERDNYRPSPMMAYLRSRLPKTELNTLHLSSGTVPPSEGVIFDKNGRIVSQSVGYGDDHYLPFNLKHLGKLKGGEYVRTRTFGGPTTEDMYTGLITGARAMTVVSHNGTYTVEFDDDLKGGRRFNDKAARIVGRYGQLLDAVQSKQVTTGGIHPSRYAELEQKATGRGFDRDRDEASWKTEMARLQKIERRNPSLSQAQRNQAVVDFMNSVAEKRGLETTKTYGTEELGTYMSSDELVRDEANKVANGIVLRARNAATPITAAERDNIARDQINAWNRGTPEEAARNFATHLGVEKQLDAALAAAEKANAATLTPLALDAQGYDSALHALQEQFPYYIKRVEYHPWVDGTSHRDTGYVRPRHNRPAEALAGFFDPKVNGKGKFFADSTRYQNHAVHGLREVPAGLKRTSTEGSGGAAPAAHEAGISPDDARQMMVDAIVDLHADFRKQTAFSPMVKVPGYPDAQLGGMNVRLALDEPKMAQAFPNLHWFLSLREDQLEPLLTKERIRQTTDRIRAAIKENDDALALDLDRSKVRIFNNEGKSEPVKHVGDKAADHLKDVEGAEYDFGSESPIYGEGSQASSHAVNEVYAHDPRIIPLIRDGHLPATLDDGMEFAHSSGRLKSALVAQREQLKNWKRINAEKPGTAGPMPIEEHDLHRHAEGLLRAQQLQRRHVEAKQREVQVVPTAWSGEKHEVHLHLNDDLSDDFGSTFDMLRRAKIVGDDNRTIQGN